MSTQKEIKIITKSGMVIRIPRATVQNVILPTVVIDERPFRLNVNMNKLENDIQKIKKKFHL